MFVVRLSYCALVIGISVSFSVANAKREMKPETFVSSENLALRAVVTARIDPNTASKKSLMRLPGIGPVIAEAIVADRLHQGAYEKAEDLLRVARIGPKVLARLKPLLYINAVK